MKKGILVISFGTSYEETLKKNIEAIENKIRDAFSPIEVRRAFTSNMIIKKLKREQGLEIHTPEEALKAMVEDGFTEIYVQPLHVIPGFEYEKVRYAAVRAKHNKQVKIQLGMPLLNLMEHYHEMVNIFDKEFAPEREGHGYVLMGHGTEHFANAAYTMLQRIFDDKRSDVIIANVEGYPELDHVLDHIRSEYQSVTLYPLMMVAGDHAQNDMIGDEEDSFKSILTAEGLTVDYVLKGMGEYEDIQSLFVKRVKDILGDEGAEV